MSTFENVAAAVDCTSLLRRRVHPGQIMYYRGDIHGHQLTAQLLCDLRGRMIEVVIGLGHNNDAGLAILTKLKSRLPFAVLADSGYSGAPFVTPDSTRGKTWNNKQKGARSVVEVVFHFTKCFEAAEQKFRGAPEFQGLAVMTIFEIVAWYLKQFPLRQ